MTLAMTLQGMVGAWSTFYQASTPMQITMEFLHIGGLVGAGGLAVSSDRDLLKLRRAGAAEREAHLERQRGVHRTVLAALAIVTLSGVAFLLADLDTYLGSRTFLVKMGFVVLLFANGAWMMRLERALGRDASRDREWSRMRLAAGVSLALWFVITFLGVVVTDAA
jgi:uncharacterized membrane protein